MGLFSKKPKSIIVQKPAGLAAPEGDPMDRSEECCRRSKTSRSLPQPVDAARGRHLCQAAEADQPAQAGQAAETSETCQAAEDQRHR